MSTMKRTWKFYGKLEADGDKLYVSNDNLYFVACESPFDIEGEVDDYLLDIDKIKKGEVSINPDSEMGFYYCFPRINGYGICERFEAAKKLHHLLHRLGVAPEILKWKIVFDARFCGVKE